MDKRYEIELNGRTGKYDLYFWMSDGWHELVETGFASELAAMLHLHSERFDR